MIDWLLGAYRAGGFLADLFNFEFWIVSFFKTGATLTKKKNKTPEEQKYKNDIQWGFIQKWIIIFVSPIFV